MNILHILKPWILRELGLGEKEVLFHIVSECINNMKWSVDQKLSGWFFFKLRGMLSFLVFCFRRLGLIKRFIETWSLILKEENHSLLQLDHLVFLWGEPELEVERTMNGTQGDLVEYVFSFQSKLTSLIFGVLLGKSPLFFRSRFLLQSEEIGLITAPFFGFS